jgi:hypothetical protein
MFPLSAGVWGREDWEVLALVGENKTLFFRKGDIREGEAQSSQDRP